MHLRSLKKTKKDVSLHDSIGTDKEGNEITLIDILGSETDDVIKEVDLKIRRARSTAISISWMTGKRKSSSAASALTRRGGANAARDR